MDIIFFVVVLFFAKHLFSKSKKDEVNSPFKKIMLGILYFAVFFVVYYFAITICLVVLTSIFSMISSDGYDNGLWGIGIILGLILAPILSIISTKRKLSKKNNNTNVETLK